MKRKDTPIKKNNAHLVQKDKLVLHAYNLEMAMKYGKPKLSRLPVRFY